VKALALACCLLAAPAHAGWDRGRQLCLVQDGRIAEASGIAVSSRNPGVFYLHNDSGDSARFFAVSSSGRTLATFNVANARAVDWEDIALGPDSAGRPTVFLADIGDNAAKRAECAVYAVPEPAAPKGGKPATRSVTARELRFRYPDGPHDAETLMVDPRTRALYVVTKERRRAPSQVFRLMPYFGGPVQTAKRVGEVAFSDALPLYPDMATGGDISSDGRRMVIRTYQQAYEWELAKGETPEEALKRKPSIVSLILEQQGEGICYGRGGRTLYTVSEQRPTPVYVYRWTK
jgi:hypothetical protein